MEANSEINRLSVTSLINKLDNKKTDPIEIFEHSLEKATESEGVFISITESRGREDADASYARYKRGEKLSVLDGIPVCWKDNIDIANYLTTNGSKPPKDMNPKRKDAYIVESTRRNGLCSMGKTNLSELAFSGLGINSHYGTPYRSEQKGDVKIPGGSSSGSAIAVAEGIVPFAVGTDTAGSIRIPAAFNGLVGYRPSTSRHNKRGVAALSPSLDAVGTLANNVSDCLYLDSAMRASSRRDFSPDNIDCISVMLDESLIETVITDENVKNDFYRTINALSDAGINVKRQRVDSINKVLELIKSKGWLGSLEAYLEHYPLISSDSEGFVDRRIKNRLSKCSEFSLKTYAELIHQRSVLQSMLSSEIGNALLILPTVGHYAPSIKSLDENDELFASMNLETLKVTMIGSYLDMPTFSLPNITTGDDYSGFQISMPMNNDIKLSKAALTIEKIITDV